MKRFYALRKKGSDQMVYVLASTEHRALMTAPGKESDWEVLGSNEQMSFLKNETLFKEIYNKTAKHNWMKEKI